MHRASLRVIVLALVTAALVTAALVAVASPGAAARTSGSAPAASRQWQWPVGAFRLVKAYQAPAHPYGPGHRGIDLAPETASVRSPAEGIVAFAGQVAGRDVLTIDHGDGLVTTLEPVRPTVSVGTALARGAEVGELSVGGHVERGTVHFGVRLDGEYINPLLLLGTVPRAVLLPCC